jgi:hypothetical protein
MDIALLVYTQEQGISRLDERISPQHFCHLHTSKLHKSTITYKCDFTMTTKTCIQSWVQYMDYIGHQRVDWQWIGKMC